LTESAPPEPIDLSLDAPSAYLFTGEICTRAYRLNRFAFDFKYPAVRERFERDPEKLMSEYGLSEPEKALVRARDWTGLVASGGHHFNVIKIAAAVGESHLHVGAHMCGASWDEFKQTLPHRIELMPQDLRDKAAKSGRDAPSESNRAPCDSGSSRGARRED
jgi:protocatechuate 4,5-dioxygenase alpha chain